MIGDGSYFGDGDYYGGADALVIGTLALTEVLVTGETFKIKKDATRPSIVKQLKRPDGTVVDLTLADSVKLFTTDADGNQKIDGSAAVITDAPGGWVRYDFVAADTDTKGTYRAEWEVNYSDGEVERIPLDTYDKIRVYTDLEV